jgi:hypothetical protein
MAWAQRAAKLLPLGELAVVPGSPHNANYSAATVLAELVLPSSRARRSHR